MNETNKNGMTLTELLVASVLIGIVMLGVASFGVSIQQFQSSTSKSTIISMRTTAAMNRMAKDAYLAVGDATDRGIIPYTGAASIRTICFRHDTNDPSSYADDTWTCYLSGGSNYLWLCNPPTPAANVPVEDINDCDVNGGSGARRFLLDLDPAQSDYYQVVEDADNRLEYVDITLSTIYDNSLPIHPITNPEYTLTTRVSPPGHGR